MDSPAAFKVVWVLHSCQLSENRIQVVDIHHQEAARIQDILLDTINLLTCCGCFIFDLECFVPFARTVLFLLHGLFTAESLCHECSKNFQSSTDPPFGQPASLAETIVLDLCGHLQGGSKNPRYFVGYHHLAWMMWLLCLQFGVLYSYLHGLFVTIAWTVCQRKSYGVQYAEF
jgi:hypothetical protein